VENASYGLTICAERAAVCAAVAAGARRIRRVVVVSDADPPAAPCGACRQVLSEFGSDFKIDGVGPKRTVSWTMAELLPAAFGPDQLR
jgi:cytidine deaminase